MSLPRLSILSPSCPAISSPILTSCHRPTLCPISVRPYCPILILLSVLSSSALCPISVTSCCPIPISFDCPTSNLSHCPITVLIPVPSPASPYPIPILLSVLPPSCSLPHHHPITCRIPILSHPHPTLLPVPYPSCSLSRIHPNLCPSTCHSDSHATRNDNPLGPIINTPSPT